MISVFDIFKIGIGPSSSHTVGPMKAGKQFTDDLIARNLLKDVTRVVVDVYGSLSLTGKGHHTDIAIIMGLAGNLPDTVDIDSIPGFIQDVNTHGRLMLANGQHEVEFPVDQCMNFHADNLSLHENGMRITALAGDKVVYSQTYYSIGGGFIVDEETSKVLAKTDEMEANGKLPNVVLAILPIVCVAVVLNVLKQDISVALLSGIVLCCILFFKNITGVQKLLTDAVSSAAVTTINASAIVAIGSVVKAAPGFNQIVNGILNFSTSGGNPLIIFGIATTLLCGLNASGMGGLSTTLSVLAEPFMAMGVNPAIMHRIGVIASVGLDSLPHSGGIVAVLAISGVSYKEGYKYLFVVTVVITLLALALALVLGNIMYPIAA